MEQHDYKNSFTILVKGKNFNKSYTIFYRRSVIIVQSVHLDLKGTLSTVIQWNSSSTDDVCSGNRRTLNSRHTEICHIQLNNCMCHGTQQFYIAFPTTLPAVLADSLLHFCFLRVGYEHEHIQHYVSESVQSCDASKQLFQGEK